MKSRFQSRSDSHGRTCAVSVEARNLSRGLSMTNNPPDPLNILLTQVDIVANYLYLEVHVESKPDHKGGLLRNLSCRCSISCWSLVALLRQQAGETHQKISTLE